MLKSFKQFLEEQDIHAKKITDAPAWAPKYAESSYQIGTITFSASDGLGAVPYNQSVYYHGFVGLVKPSTFLNLALPHDGQRGEDSSKIEGLVKDGYALGIPWFSLNTQAVEEGTGLAKIVGHEGRARMLFIQRELGDVPVPVHFILTGGARSRDLTPEMIQSIKGGIKAEGSGTEITDPIKTAYLDGSEV